MRTAVKKYDMVSLTCMTECCEVPAISRRWRIRTRSRRETHRENLLEFKSVIYDYEKEDPNITLAEFMERIALLAEVDNHDADENAVVMMTMHSAKGLEFPFVFLPGMEDGSSGWRAFDREDGLEEERRLCYVGMTRGRSGSWLMSAERSTFYGKTEIIRQNFIFATLTKQAHRGRCGIREKEAQRRRRVH